MKSTIFLGIILFLSGTIIFTSCTTQAAPRKFDPKTCLETVPKHVKGLQVLPGLRTKKSIIIDMVSPVCNSQVLFRKMKDQNQNILPGKAIFHVTVEYTGEVAHVAVEESNIQSNKFLNKVKDFIMDTDFILIR